MRNLWERLSWEGKGCLIITIILIFMGVSKLLYVFSNFWIWLYGFQERFMQWVFDKMILMR